MDESKDWDEYTNDKEKPENNEDILIAYVLAYLTHNGVPIIKKVDFFYLLFYWGVNIISRLPQVIVVALVLLQSNIETQRDNLQNLLLGVVFISL